MVNRRSKRNRSKPVESPPAADPDESDAEEAADSRPRRVSSRRTKFTQSMKEQSDSIADLLKPDPPPAKVAGNRKGKRSSGGGAGNGRDSDGSDHYNVNDDDDDEGPTTRGARAKQTRAGRAKKGDKMPEKGGGSGDDDDNSDDDENLPTRGARGKQTRGGRAKKDAKTPEKGGSGGGAGKKKQPKSPAVRHKTKRRIVKTEVQVSSAESESDDEDEEEESEEEGEVGEEEDELKIQRVIASRSETRRKWREICRNMNTSEIENGSRWFQEDDGGGERDDVFEERFFVKWSDLSFLHCSWELEEDLVQQIEGARAYLTTFFRKSMNGLLFAADERLDGEYFDPSFVQVERILEIDEEGIEEEEDVGAEKKKKDGKSDDNKATEEEVGVVQKFGIVLDKDHPDFETGTGRQFLVKWGNSPYSDSSYEFERDLILNDVEYEEQAHSFTRRRKKPNKGEMKKASSIHEEQTRRLYKVFGDNVFMPDEQREEKIKSIQKKLEDHVFPNGGQLRDYQAEGVSWMIANYINKRSSILADEMGLGKTIQTAVFVNYLATALGSRGPYLVVAPLSTLQHWYREFSSWTNLNTIVYHGSARDREYIREYEFAFEEDRPHNLPMNASFLKRCHKKTLPKWERTWMATVVVTTPEMLVTDDFSELTAVNWELLIVDEAHRLKNHSSKLAVNLRDDRFKFKSILLLTGTPIQNNMSEMWTLLNVVDGKKFDDVDKFLERWGDIKSKEKLDELHEQIRPYILRRLKEDVEKSVPPKEETLIEVELTILQKQYYRALYEKNVQFLHRNKKKALDGPSINNLAMQLRKCCNHPFLLRGVEEEVRSQESGSASEGDFLVKASGKLVLLDKLLPKLREGGHRVLIFSQFKIMLDILEDYLSLREFKAERIDGSITGKKRQMAIDRFQAKDSASFIMMLSTRAGGVGINLTAADTCIIFDSDWNPQNDLQAQARCHRIGQTKSVKVYRLLSRKSYEMQMFHMSSLKMGLDQAVLQGIEGGSSGDGGEGALTKEEVEKLLRHGAYDIFNEEKTGASEKESNEFEDQDIDSILERRTKTVVHENTGSKSTAAGGTFSKASFKAAQKNSDAKATEDVDIDDPEFWKKMVGEARVKDDKNDLAGKKRKRKQANYSEKDYERRLNATLLAEDREASSSVEDNAGSSSENDDSASSGDEDHEFDSPGKELKNELLQKLKEEEKRSRQNREKSRWGGKGINDWRKGDAEAVLKVLQTYGYGDTPWEELTAKMEFEKPESYSSDEVKRMCWAFALTLLREAVDDEVRDAEKKAERAAGKKKREVEGERVDPPVDGGLLGNVKPKSPEELEKEVVASFGRLWMAHSPWAKDAIKDALDYAKERAPRSPGVLGSALGEVDAPKEIKLTPLAKAFNDNVWPALRSRGWKDDNINGKKGYSYGGEVYRSVSAVLDAVSRIHPELSNTIESIVTSVASATAESKKKEANDTTKILDPENVTPQALTNLLRSYAPLQLVVDRTKVSKIAVHSRKFLGTLSFMRTAHVLVNRVDGEAGEQTESDLEKKVQLEKLLTVERRAMLPHPLWSPRHDAVLIRAIAKHGWIDRERACLAIAHDDSIKWGSPFGDGPDLPAEEGTERDVSPLANVSFDELKPVAERVAALFNAENVMVYNLKGFNHELLVRSYGLVQRRTADVPIPTWDVDENLLRAIVKNGGIKKGTEVEGSAAVRLDLPSRKDLVKRAKVVLMHSSSAVEASPSALKPGGSSHDFSVLDQSNGCNLFLAELLHAVLKISITKGDGQKVCRKLLLYASKEVEHKIGTTEPSKPGEEMPSGVSVVDSDARKLQDDMKKLQENIRLVSRTIKVWHRQAKNVLRCILGMEPLQPKGGGSLFPVERYNALPQPVKPPFPNAPKAAFEKSRVEELQEVKRVQQKQKESAIGDVAINRALAAGLKKGKLKQPMSEDGIIAPTLNLTSIETLILSVICSQGLPCWAEEWEALVDPQCCMDGEACPGEEFVINWYRMGGVVLNAATVWHEIARRNLQQKRGHLERNMNDMSEDQVQGFKLECEQLQQDLDRKLQAIADARQLRADPHQLARKSIMMLESLRRLMGPVETKSAGALKKLKDLSRQENGLGPRVVQWCCKELNRWANSLNIVDDDGKCIGSTASDYMEDVQEINLAALFDKRACRNIFIQVAQQTRLRSIFIKNGTNEMFSLLPKAIKNSWKNGDVWDRCPPWWCSDQDADKANACKDDIDLLVGLLDFGYSGFDEMLRQNSSFRLRIEEETRATRDSVDGNGNARSTLTRASAQQRLNHLTRELNALEDTADVMRLVSERANRKLMLQDQGTPQEEEEKSSKRLSSIQTGIDNFFQSSQASAKKTKTTSKVSDTESVSSVEILEVGDESSLTEKRKPGENDAIQVSLSPSKKQKAS